MLVGWHRSGPSQLNDTMLRAGRRPRGWEVPFSAIHMDQLVFLSLLLVACHGSVHLFFTNGLYTPNSGLDPNTICTSDGRASSHPNLGIGVTTYRALALTARTQDLTSMFPSSVQVYDASLPPRLIANDAAALFASLSPLALPNMTSANGAGLPSSTYFWSGSLDASGKSASSNCGDFTDSGVQGKVGRLDVHVGYTTASCSQTCCQKGRARGKLHK